MKSYSNKKNKMKLSPLKLALSAGIVSMLAASSIAAEEMKDTGVEEQVEKISVTGSRIKSGGFDSPVPVTSIGSEYFKSLSLNSVGEALGQMPQNTPAVSAATVGLGNFDIGAALANLRGLNPFFGTRTLTLVDGKRFVPSTAGGAVDLNMIPTIMVDRLDVVTGGASAAYGADAISGVINILLDKDLEGFKVDVSRGQSSEGDGEETKIAFAGGTSVMDGRGHFVFGIEHVDNKGVGDCAAERDWCAKSPGVFTNTNYATNGESNYIIGNGATDGYVTPTGVFPFLGIAYNEAGSMLTPFDAGNYPPSSYFGSTQGGDNPVTPYATGSITPPVERTTLYTHFEFDISEELTFLADLSYGKREATNTQGSSPAFFAPVWADNYYINNGLAADPSLAFGPGVLPPLGAYSPFTSFAAAPYLLIKNNSDIVRKRNETENETYRLMIGLEGALNDNWSWDAYLTYGKNEQSQHVHNSQVASFQNWAIDVIDDGSGNPICRAEAMGVPGAEGCVPMNPFGIDNVTSEAGAYVFRTNKEFFTYEQTVLAGNVYGDLFELPAGAVSVAVGLEYRYEKGDVTHGTDAWRDDFSTPYGQDYTGESTVIETYVEAEVPLARDIVGVDYLGMNVALRYSDYENEGDDGKVSDDNTTWKVSLQYQPIDWLNVRATRSRDVRAPSFKELYGSSDLPAGNFFGNVSNPWAGGVSNSPSTEAGGSVSLIPEEADTTTFGVVFQPMGWADGLRVSVDYFSIELNEAISALPGGQTFVDACFNTGDYCERVTRGVDFFGNDEITHVNATAINVDKFTSEGYDIEVDYTMSLEGDGVLNFRLLASHASKLLVEAGGTSIDYAGQTGPVGSFGDFNPSPDWQYNAHVSYMNGPLMLTLQGRYIAEGEFSAEYIEGTGAINTINDNTVDSALYTTLSGSYRFDLDDGQTVELYGTIKNLMDEDPSVAPGGNGSSTNPTFFDTIGRYYTVGVRASF